MRWRRRNFEQDMRDELNAHVEHRADDLMASGMTRAEATRRARVELGAMETYKEQWRDERALGTVRRFVDQTWRDVRMAVRRLCKAPTFATFAVGSIGVGAGVTTAIFSVIYAFAWASNGVRKPSEVVLVANQLQSRAAWDPSMSLPDFEDFRHTQKSFALVSAAAHFSLPLTDAASTTLIEGEAISGSYFQTMGVEPVIGRTIQPRDDEADAPTVAVLSYSFWKSQYSADPTVIGRMLRIGGAPVEIVGVAPRGFRGLNMYFAQSGAWISLSALHRLNPADASAPDRAVLSVAVAARLKPDVRIAQAQSELDTISAAFDRAFQLRTRIMTAHGVTTEPGSRGWMIREINRAGNDSQRAVLDRAAVAVIAVVALVLMVACTNLANLTLARGAGREQELAVRLALGASRARLVRELLTESLCVGAASFFVAMLVCVSIMNLASTVLNSASSSTSTIDPRLDGAAVLAAVVAVALALIVCGLWPALKLSRADVRSTIARGGGSGTPPWRSQGALIRVQVVISVAFFCVSAIFISALAAQTDHDSGIVFDGLTIARTPFRAQKWDEARAQRAVQAIVAGASSSEFRTVAVANGLPFGAPSRAAATVSPIDRAPTRNDMIPLIVSSPGLFDALGISIVHGRAFDQRDGVGAQPVAVLSESAAVALFGSADVVGRDVHVQGFDTIDSKTVETRTVIGISRDTDVGTLMDRAHPRQIFLPMAQRYETPVIVVARSRANTAGGLRALIHRADEDVPVDSVGSGFRMLGGLWLLARIAAVLSLVLGVLTLVLTMAGLFGVLSHVVLRRSREIAIRKALGADNVAIRWMVLKDGGRPVVTGAAIGLFIGMLGGYLVRFAIPFGTAVVQPMAIGIVLLAIVPSTLIACYVPARRAMHVDANTALKEL